MSLETWVAFCITEAALCLMPGPAVVLVVSIALGRGLRPGLAASWGIVATNTLYFALSAAGVAAVVATSRDVFLVLKWVGAAYLVWLGLRMLLSRRAPPTEAVNVPIGRSFLRGFVVQGANPKALAFFVALLPQFIDTSAPVAGQVLLLGVSSVVIELAVLSFYAQAAVRAGHLAGTGVARALERVGGSLLIAAGARLAVIRSE